jgi:hypothetical protein
LVADLGIAPEELPQVASKYVLGGQAVSPVIVGMRSIKNVERNATLPDETPLTATSTRRSPTTPGSATSTKPRRPGRRSGTARAVVLPQDERRRADDR